MKKIEYNGHINLMSMKNCETIYAIDYSFADKTVKEEFEFIV